MPNYARAGRQLPQLLLVDMGRSPQGGGVRRWLTVLHALWGCGAPWIHTLLYLPRLAAHRPTRRRPWRPPPTLPPGEGAARALIRHQDWGGGEEWPRWKTHTGHPIDRGSAVQQD